jgi:hypothetical protein
MGRREGGGQSNLIMTMYWWDQMTKIRHMLHNVLLQGRSRYHYILRDVILEIGRLRLGPQDARQASGVDLRSQVSRASSLWSCHATHPLGGADPKATSYGYGYVAVTVPYVWGRAREVHFMPVTGCELIGGDTGVGGFALKVKLAPKILLLHQKSDFISSATLITWEIIQGMEDISCLWKFQLNWYT